MALNKKEMYGQVAEGLISLMESGVAPWSKPWIVRGADDPWLPHNGFSGRRYNGFNSLYLSLLMRANSWDDPRFYTWKNVDAAGGKVCEGEEKKFTVVVYNKRVTKQDESDPDKVSAFYLMKYYRVYNACQVSGLPEFDSFVPDDSFIHDDSFPVAEGVVSEYEDASSVRIGFGGDRAFYQPSMDVIQMPEREQFSSLAAFYQTLFHEVIHSTGHSSRQDRLGERSGFGSDEYAKEELVAEFGAAFLCANTDVPLAEDASAAYLKSWAARCKDDPGMLVTAVNAAQRAADFVLDYSRVEALV